MAKQDYIFRYLTIVKKLRRSREATFEEIREYLERESEFQDRPFSISKRTFLRDLNEIRQLFRIDIRYDFSARVYSIADDLQTDLNNRMLESVDTINSLKVASDIGRYMFFEKREAAGTHHFRGLLYAIRNRIVLSLVHKKYDDHAPVERRVEPFALKESKGRWYLFARDLRDRKLKTFGLDRIVDFSHTAGRFDYPPGLDVNEVFRHSFGVINPDDTPPEELVLRFEPAQGPYIKSYPLHPSQTILADSRKEFRIRLFLSITHDLVMEILSYGETVKVIRPARLARRIRTIAEKVVMQYPKKSPGAKE